MSLNLRPRQTDDDGDAPIVLISSWHREDQFKSNLATFNLLDPVQDIQLTPCGFNFRFGNPVLKTGSRRLNSVQSAVSFARYIRCYIYGSLQTFFVQRSVGC